MQFFYEAPGLLRDLLLYPASTPAIIALLAVMFLLAASSRLKALVILLNILISLRYILWRGFYTLNTVDYIAITLSGVLIAAEAYGFVQNILFYYQSHSPSRPVPPPGSDKFLPTVDVFVTIYNEPEEILVRTVVGCMAQDYPADRFNVIVCDDGRRPEIEGLCSRLGCGYITRPDNRDAKAGNVNNALRRSKAGFIAIFDCDHIPVRSFLKETVPFFADPRVAIVQVPHHFYNPDIYQRNLRLEREISNEQDLFFHVIEPGKDRYNSAFFAGSCGVFRKSALDETGGILTKTLTEDIHTSMELHARGYRSVYLNKDLSAGLSPESSAGYIKQRQRWAKGGVQVFLLDNPLLKKGLSFHQRLQYLASLIYFFHGFPRVIYLSAPLAYLLFSYHPLAADIKTLLYYFLPHYAATLIAFGMVSKGFRNPFWSDVYETLMSFVLMAAAIGTFLKPSGHAFVVTPKGERHREQRLETSVIFPHMALALLLAAGAALGAWGLYHDSLNRGPAAVSVIWASYNVLILFAAILSARERPMRRASTRLARTIRCELVLPDKTVSTVTRDISETGLSVFLTEPVFFPDRAIRVNLTSGYGERTCLKGRIARYDKEDEGFVIGISYVEMNDELHHGVIRQMFSPEESWGSAHVNGSPALAFFGHIAKTASRAFRPERNIRRVAPRFGVRRRCVIGLSGGGSVQGTTIEISATGLSVEAGMDAAIGQEVSVDVERDGRKISIKGVTVWNDPKIRVLGLRFLDAAEGGVFLKEAGPFSL